MKVVWYHNAFPVLGGSQKVTADLASAFIKGYPDITPLVVTNKVTGSIDGIRCIGLSSEMLAHNPAVQAELIDILRREKADVFIQPEDSPRGLLEKIKRELPGLKIIYHLHSTPLWQVTNRMTSLRRKIMERLFHLYSRRYRSRCRHDYSACDAWVCLCGNDARTLGKILGDKVTAINNSLDLGRFSEYQSDARKRKEVLFMGRLTRPDKRVDRLLRVWQAVGPRHPDWQLKIVGTGPDEDALKEMASRLRLSNVCFCGRTDNPAGHYNTASILCLTSRFEGWPLVLPEALACGVRPLAMLCSNGVREIIEKSGSRGVPPGDEKAFADALDEMMQSPDANDPAVVLPFLRSLDPRAIVARWVELLHSV